MATSTTNLGLIKPAGTDKIRIAQINSNMDVIDTKMGAVGNTPLQTQVSALNTEMGGKAYTIFLESSDNTWDKVYAKISKLTSGKPALIYCNNAAMEVLSNGARTSASPHGIITKTSNTVYHFVLKTTTQHMFLANLTVSNGGFSSWIEREIIDTSSYALVSSGDAHSAIASGEFVYVYNHGTLSDGLYTAKSSIAANAALSTSNLTAVSGGGLNSLKADIDTLNSKMGTVDIFYKGTVIPDGSDINSYRTPGKYYSASAANTSTMSNAPVIGGFSLLVVINGYDWVNQYGIPVNGTTIKHRYYTYSNSTWSSWQTLTFA